MAGNLIGTDVTGTRQLGNAWDNIFIGTGCSGNTIGGTTSGARNVISGSLSWGGIEIWGAGDTVDGNFIGTDVNGAAGLGNATAGVYLVNGASGNTIGGTTPGARNIISANHGDGVYFWASGLGNVVEGNYIGTDKSGTSALGNFYTGVSLNNGSTNNVIGGTNLGAGNLISGNGTSGVAIWNLTTTGNLVAGNLIGTDVYGTGALGNASSGVFMGGGATGNTVGGTTIAARNIISANRIDGVQFWDHSSGNFVEGNYIGTDVTGAAPLGNGFSGVQIQFGCSNNLIGGGAAGARNILSGNNWGGVFVIDPGTDHNLIQGNYVGTNAAGTAGMRHRSLGRLRRDQHGDRHRRRRHQ